MRTRLIVALGCAAGLLGCGSDGGSETATGASQLSPSQYAELERLYAAQVPIERLVESDDPADLRRASRLTARSCEAVDTSDPLLAATVDGCEQAVAVAALGAQDCATAEQCERQLVTLAELLKELVAGLERAKPTIDRELSDAACRDALLSDDQLSSAQQLVETIERVNDAIAANDIDELTEAQADFEQAQKAFDALPSTRQQLRRLRAACRPAAA